MGNKQTGRGDAMRSLYFSLIIAFYATVSVLDTAEAAGTLRLTFKQKDASGNEQPLANAYVYLRTMAAPPPMEKYFSKPEYIYGPTNSLGVLQVSVPDGDYFIRATRRNPFQIRPFGPPEPGDLTWTPIIPITIANNTVTDLGTQYAESFAGEKIKLFGKIKSSYGTPIPGKYVRVQVVPCIMGTEYTSPNYCGPVKYLAEQRTDANGEYSITLRNPGTYYVVVSHTLGQAASTIGKSVGPYTVQAGAKLKIPDIIYQW
jgi:hypothetical protein